MKRCSRFKVQSACGGQVFKVRRTRLSILSREEGYTLVETLVAGAILMGVLVPALLFLGRVTASRSAADLITASQLAFEEMERTLAYRLFEDDEREVQAGPVTWQVCREISGYTDLVLIHIKVYRQPGMQLKAEAKILKVRS